MLPSDPVQQLPLLPATHTAATSRVAAWLLDTDGAANDAAGGAAVHVEAAVPAHHPEGSDSGDDCADLALLHLHDALDEAATEVRRRPAHGAKDMLRCVAGRLRGAARAGGGGAWASGARAAACSAAPGSLACGS